MKTNHRAGLLRIFACSTAVAGCDLAYPLGDYQALDPDGATKTDAAAAGLIQTATGQASDTREIVVALAKSATIGNALVLVAVSNETLPLSVSSAGVTWTAMSFSSKQVAVAIWAGFVPLGGSASVTVRWAASPALAQGTALAHLSEWRGLSALGPEVHASGTGGGPITTGSLLAKEGTVLLLAAAGGHTAGIGPPTNGFTALPSIALDDYRLDLAYVHAPPAGSYATSWTYPSTKGWEALLVSFTR